MHIHEFQRFYCRFWCEKQQIPWVNWPNLLAGSRATLGREGGVLNPGGFGVWKWWIWLPSSQLNGENGDNPFNFEGSLFLEKPSSTVYHSGGIWSRYFSCTDYRRLAMDFSQWQAMMVGSSAAMKIGTSAAASSRSTGEEQIRCPLLLGWCWAFPIWESEIRSRLKV